MARLTQLIREIHRRSLWQVLTIYLGASWAVLEVTDQIVARYLLPEWVYPAALILLLVGLPIVLATAFVREEREPAAIAEPRDPTLLGEPVRESSAAAPLGGPIPTPVAQLLTWPRAILGGVLAFTALGIVSAFIVLRGTARVTEAYGAAGDAFEERAWIVVADFAAPEGEEEIALAAREALTIDLQQSQYVNVFGLDQVASVLRRMEFPDTAFLDRGLALEIAEREGLAAVLVGRVSRLGEDYVFGARIVQPGTRQEIIAVRSAARADRLLEGVERLSREVRARLGEESEAIRRSRPLPEVTTRSLDALKVYAQAVETLARESNSSRAFELALEATRLDTTFAMAYRLAAVTSSNLGRAGEAIAHGKRAYELRDRLAERERLHVEAFYFFNVALDPRRAAQTYELILSRYPDDGRAANNLGVVSGLWLGDYERAYQAYRPALENYYSASAHTGAISAAHATGRWEAVDSIIALAVERGFGANVIRHRIGQAFGRGEWDRAEALCDSLPSATSSGSILASHRFYCGSIDVARGRLARGTGRLEEAAKRYADGRQFWWTYQTVSALMFAEQMRRRPAAARSHLDAVLARFPADSVPDRDRFYGRTNIGVVAGVAGRIDLLEQLEESYAGDSDVPEWLNRYGKALTGAAVALAEGDAERALELLRKGNTGDNQLSFWRTSVDLLYGLAFEGIGEVDSAVAHLEAALDPGVLAQWWQIKSKLHLPFVLLRLAELEESRGNDEAAIQHYQRFLELWSDPDPEVRDQMTAAQRALARLTTAETS